MISSLPITSVTAMADENDRFRQTQQLLAQMMAKDDSNAPSRLNLAMQTYAAWIRYPEFEELKEVVSKDWQEMLNNIEEAAPSETQKVILFASCFTLPLQDSLQCLDKIADFCLDNVIDRRTFEWAIRRYELTTGHSLAHNYEDVVVVDILRKAKIICADDLKKIQQFDAILSGNTKKAMMVSGHENSDNAELAHIRNLNTVQGVTAVKKIQPVSVPVTGEQSSIASDKPTGTKNTPWAIPLLISVIVIGGVVTAWCCFREKGK